MLKQKLNIIFFGLLFVPIMIIAQEDVASQEDMIIEQQQINFDTFFFEALQQKSIDNFDKAIYALEACQDIDPDNLAVLFEFSKNYFYQNKFSEAEYYGLKALQISPNNLYLIRHLKDIKLKKNDYKGAIKFQKLIISQNSEEEADLIFIYIRSGDVKSAKTLLQKLENENRLPDSFSLLKESLLQEKSLITQENEIILMPVSRLDKLKSSYRSNNDFETLKQVLNRELKTKQYLILLNDSKDAINKYPSQPFVYMVNGTALNKLSKYNEAIDILNAGLEFVVEDFFLESQFMEQLSLSHKGIGENKTATIYYNKMLDLRKK